MYLELWYDAFYEGNVSYSEAREMAIKSSYYRKLRLFISLD